MWFTPNFVVRMTFIKVCKLNFMQNDDSKIKTHHSDYYADIILHQKPESQSATSSQHTSKRSSSLSSDNYPVRPLPRAGKSLTFKSITVPAGLNSRHLQYNTAHDTINLCIRYARSTSTMICEAPVINIYIDSLKELLCNIVLNLLKT